MKALDLAGWVVNYCISKNNPISNLQLQKILYFIQLQSFKEESKALIDPCEFEAWLFGPVIREVYYAYCVNGGLPITTLAKDFMIPKNLLLPPFVKKIVDKAITLEPWDLVKISHRDNGAWAQTYIEGQKLPIKDYLIRTDADTFELI